MEAVQYTVFSVGEYMEKLLYVFVHLIFLASL
jgi:hypothetical protein